VAKLLERERNVDEIIAPIEREGGGAHLPNKTRRKPLRRELQR